MNVRKISILLIDSTEFRVTLTVTKEAFKGEYFKSRKYFA